MTDSNKPWFGARFLPRIRALLDLLRQHLSHQGVLLALALLGIVAGGLSAGISLLFRFIIDWPLALFLPGNNAENFEGLPLHLRFLVPAIGALLVGLLLLMFRKEHRGVGVSHVVNRLNNHHGWMPWQNAVAQFCAGAIALISGQSGGREGPAVHLGAAINSLTARFLHLPNNSTRILISCGVAAAISAAFNTPIAGVIFAMEVVMLEYTIIGFTPVILAAVTGALMTRAVYGAEPMFTIALIDMNSASEVFFIALIGLVCGTAAALFIIVQKFCLRWSALNILLRLSIVGVLTGAIAVVVPQVLGLGYDTLQILLSVELSWWFLLLIIVAKLFLTAVACGMGMPIGYIGPSLIIGACIGSALAIFGIGLRPDLASDATLYVLLGMGAMMAAILNAPLAALLTIVELTHNPYVILPGMLAVIIATLTVSGLYRQKSAVQTILESQGFKIVNDPLSQALQRAAVASLMDQNFRSVAHTMTAEEINTLLGNRPRWLIVQEADSQKRLLDSTDLVLYMQEYGEELEPSQDVALLELPGKQRLIINVHPQATLREALDVLEKEKVDALHVVGPALPLYMPPSGVLTRQDIENYYRYPQGMKQ
ncbi:MAG: chloride channel protein [Pseudomonadales bacterium]